MVHPANRIIYNGKPRFHRSLVETDKAIMLVGAAHEEMDVDGVEVMGVSMAAPIYEKMQDLKKGDDFELNGRKYHIKGIV